MNELPNFKKEDRNASPIGISLLVIALLVNHGYKTWQPAINTDLPQEPLKTIVNPYTKDVSVVDPRAIPQYIGPPGIDPDQIPVEADVFIWQSQMSQYMLPTFTTGGRIFRQTEEVASQPANDDEMPRE